MLFSRWVLAPALLMVFPQLTVSAEVYKWVDEAGNVHFGDSVPEQYQQVGKTVDVSGRQPTETERQQAEALAESARQAAEAARELRLEAAAAEPEEPLASNTAPTQPRPIEPLPGQARLTREQRMKNYEAEMERYRESQRCFGKYQMLGGGTRGYAFNECTSVKRPRHPDVQ